MSWSRPTADNEPEIALYDIRVVQNQTNGILHGNVDFSKNSDTRQAGLVQSPQTILSL